MTDTSRSGDLVASLRALSAWLIAKNLDLKLPDEIGDPDEAADRIEALTAENERLRLHVETQEALQVSAYHAGLRAGWNFGVSDDNAGMQAALSNTDHIKELRRIREARAALGEKQ